MGTTAEFDRRAHPDHPDIFPELAATALCPRGVVYLRTDVEDYFSQMREVFAASAVFQAVGTPEELSGTMTDFEADFQARGIQTVRAAYQKV